MYLQFDGNRVVVTKELRKIIQDLINEDNFSGKDYEVTEFDFPQYRKPRRYERKITCQPSADK